MKKMVNATTGGNSLGVTADGETDGETKGAGSRYSATITERANKSLLSDQPSRESANNGSVGQVGQSVRKTGRILASPTEHKGHH